RAAPLADELAAAFDREPVAEIVREHDLEAGEQVVLEIAGEAHQARADRHAVVHVAVEDELAVSAAFVGDRQLGRPRGGPLGCRHQLSAWPWTSAWALIVLGAAGAASPGIKIPSRAAKSASAWSASALSSASFTSTFVMSIESFATRARPAAFVRSSSTMS